MTLEERRELWNDAYNINGAKHEYLTIPEGYEAVRFGVPTKDESYISNGRSHRVLLEITPTDHGKRNRVIVSEVYGKPASKFMWDEGFDKTVKAPTGPSWFEAVP